MQLKPAVLGIVSPWSPGHSKALAQATAPPAAGLLIAAAAVSGLEAAALFGAFGDDVKNIAIYVVGAFAALGSAMYLYDAASQL